MPNGTNQEPVGSNMIDGCAQVKAWAENVNPRYLKQCHEEAHDIIEAVLNDEPLNQYLHANNKQLQMRMLKYISVKTQLERI